MSEISINKVTNCNIYLEGSSLMGQAKEVMLPTVENKMAPHNALGMIGDMEVPSGIQAMEATIVWNSFYADALKKLGVLSGAVKIQVRFSVDEYNSSGGLTSRKPGVVYMTCQPKNFPLGSFKQHENVELESKVTVYAVKLEIDSEVIMDLDLNANIYIVGGVDQLAQYRANLG